MDASRLHTLLESLNEGVLFETPERTVQLANQGFCTMFGIEADPAALVGGDCAVAAAHTATLFVDPDAFLDGIQRALRGEPVEGASLQLVDGRILERDYAPITDPKGGPPGHLWVYRDVTRHALVAEQALERSHAAELESRTKDRYMATMSHEIRTPLNGMIGLLDLLQAESMNPTASEMIAIVRQSADALLELLNDMLEFARTSSDQVVLDIAPADPLDLARSVRDLFRASAARSGVGISIASAGTVPARVLLDAGRLRQVLLNLVGNAVKFTSSGHVAIGVEYRATAGQDAAGRLVFTVEDTGSGIDPAIADRLFEPFTMGRDTGGGTGLGLAICRRLVETMHGTIGWTPRPGGGSTFVVDVPTSLVETEHVDARMVDERRLGDLVRELGDYDTVVAVVSMFLDLLDARTRAIVDARDDPKALYVAAHALKSSARTIGASAIADSAEVVERACGEPLDDTSRIELDDAIERILQQVDPTVEALRAWADQAREVV